ncbi:hypothetical protein [Agromyces sp. CCNWLW203]|uniref:hypothetical protein n=1 Tax=Agromyces sp. CCNWLW203 TaxID=3112842 RepID=UPI002F963C54
MASAFELVVVDPDAISLLGGVVRARPSAHLRASGDLSIDATVEIEIALDEALGRYVAKSVRVECDEPGGEVTAKLLREVRVQEAIVSVALRDMISVVLGEHEDDVEVLSGEEMLARVKPMRGRDRYEVVQDAMIIDAIARLGNWPPLATVAARLGVSQSTATRLVAEGRRHG